MSRFIEGDCDGEDANLFYGRWIARTNKALKGKPGQKALREFKEALLSLPHKRLVEGALATDEGMCALGGWIYRKFINEGATPKQAWRMIHTGSNPDTVDEFRHSVDVAMTVFGITRTLTEEIMFANDEESSGTTPEARYVFVLRWVNRQLGEVSNDVHPASTRSS